MRIRCVLVSAFLALALACGFCAVADARVLITVDKSTQQMTVNVDGQWRWTWPVSTGIARYDTPSGQYTAFRMEAEHFSKEWDDAPMPHSIFFTMKGHAIHGSLHTRLGQPASHGCVRLAPENAATLYALVEEQGLPNTKVVIEGEIPQEPVVAAREPAAAASMGFRLPWIETPRLQPRERQNVRQRHAARERRDYPAAQAYAAPAYPAPRTYATPFYPAPRAHTAPQAYAMPQPYAARRTYAAPRAYAMPHVYYDPRVEVTEETYVNGVKVRRHYMRKAVPGDYYGWR